MKEELEQTRRQFEGKVSGTVGTANAKALGQRSAGHIDGGKRQMRLDQESQGKTVKGKAGWQGLHSNPSGWYLFQGQCN